MFVPARARALYQGAAALVCASILAVAGCATFGDTAFLVNKVDNATKSRALTEQGIAIYEVRVLGREDYDALKEVRQYFEVALRFDPDNSRARQYLDTVDRYRERQLAAKLALAGELAKKPDRSEADTYRMLLAVRQALTLAPADPQALELKTQTEAARNALVKQYMDRARAAHDQIKPQSPRAQRERELLDVKDQYDRIAAIHPDYLDLQLRRSSVRKDLDRIFQERADEVNRRIDAREFAAARDDIDALDALNRRLDHAHDAEIRDLVYRLNFEWARTAAERGETSLAGAKIDIALRAKRTDEALALRDSIIAKSAPEARKAPAAATAPRRTAPAAAAPARPPAADDSAVREVQELVRRGELVAAHRRIEVLLGPGTDPQTAQALREQQAAIRERLADLYARGVQAYREEDFKRAIDLLSTVVEIDVDYEQASDYLDKARAKQKVLEGLQGGSR